MALFVSILFCSRPETQLIRFGGQYGHVKNFVGIDEADPLREGYPIP
jgi:hypothetical protein